MILFYMKCFESTWNNTLVAPAGQNKVNADKTDLGSGQIYIDTGSWAHRVEDHWNF